jgi:predicted TPR repeat methyltransferase
MSKFRNVSSYLIGVDLSQVILDEAEKLRPGLYDERVADDVTEVFRERNHVSLIVAADSYIYFGDLDPLFESMQDSLAEGAYLAFTLENVDAESEVT